MDEMWPWLASLPPPGADTPPRSSFPLAVSHDGASIVLQADRTSTSDDSTAESVLIGFSLAVESANGVARALWRSQTFSTASLAASRLQLLAQLLDEVIPLSPSVPSLGSNLGPDASESKLDAEGVSAVMQATGTDGDGSAFFSLALLLRLFWLCALEAPADIGYLFFQDLGPEIEHALGNCTRALGVFLLSVGPDVEDRFIRSLGYMLAKWCLLREMQAPIPTKPDLHPTTCLSYATEVHGLWVLKGYAPVLAMPRVSDALSIPITASPHELPEEPALRYGLVHQQLEAVAQLEYAVSVRDKRFISVGVRVDNIRVRVVRLGYRKNDEEANEGDVDDDVMDGERHFPSRIRLWVGPRFGSSYATGPSLGRSTGNPEREVEMTRTVKGAFSRATKQASSNGGPRVKAKMRTSARTRNRSWRWEQEAEGSAGVFEGVMCDPVTGTEVSAWRTAGNGGAGEADPRNGMRRRYGGPGRAFSKMRGLVVASDELSEEVTWRVGREEEGKMMRWRLGLKAWVSYLPNEVRSRHFETRFFWQGDTEKKKYRLALWDIVYRLKDQGGLGIHDLQVKNSALLDKWLFKLLTEDGVWQTLLKQKYIGTKALSQVIWKLGDSHFWASLMAIKKHFFCFGVFKIKYGSEIRFWEDKWLGHTTLREQYPALYNIVRHKKDTLATVMQDSLPNVTFRRDLIGPRLQSWNALCELFQGTNEFSWSLTRNAKFSVDSMYRTLVHSEVPVDNNTKIWQMKVPLKLKIFAWYLCKGVILTKDNLVKRNWHGSTKCVSCSQE